MTVYKALKEANLIAGEAVVSVPPSDLRSRVALMTDSRSSFSSTASLEPEEDSDISLASTPPPWVSLAVSVAGGPKVSRPDFLLSVPTGYRVIGIDSGEAKVKLLASYGIHDFIDFKKGVSSRLSLSCLRSGLVACTADDSPSFVVAPSNRMSSSRSRLSPVVWALTLPSSSRLARRLTSKVRRSQPPRHLPPLSFFPLTSFLPLPLPLSPTPIFHSAPSFPPTALEYLRPHGSLICVGMPPNGDIKANVFWTVVGSKRIIGSYVGNRQDAIEALDIAARGKVKTTLTVEPLGNLPSVFKRMHDLTLNGRVVLDCQ